MNNLLDKYKMYKAQADKMYANNEGKWIIESSKSNDKCLVIHLQLGELIYTITSEVSTLQP